MDRNHIMVAILPLNPNNTDIVHNQDDDDLVDNQDDDYVDNQDRENDNADNQDTENDNADNQGNNNNSEYKTEILNMDKCPLPTHHGHLWCQNNYNKYKDYYTRWAVWNSSDPDIDDISIPEQRQNLSTKPDSVESWEKK